MNFHVWMLAISTSLLHGRCPAQFSYFGASFGLETSSVDDNFQVHVYYRGINLPCPRSPDEICVALNCSTCRSRAVEASGHIANWCLLDGVKVIHLHSNPLHVRSCGDCWSLFMESPRETEQFRFTFSLFADLGRRSDDASTNTPPQPPLLPVLRVPQNCMATYNLTVYERNGDVLRCRYGLRERRECAHCAQHHFLKLDQKNCVLHYNRLGTKGAYFLELMIEEYPRDTILLTHGDGTQTVYPAFEEVSSTQSIKALSSIPMQFVIIVDNAISECAFGIVRPLLVHPTPPNGARIYASNYDEINFTINAISIDERITAFTIVGPRGLRKSDTWSLDGRFVSVNVTWSVDAHNVPKQVPVCFLSTTSSGLQSEPRCIWIVQGFPEEQPPAADLQCLPDFMIVCAPRTLVANLPDDRLQLNDASCNVTGNSTHLLLIIPLLGCGTVLLEDKSHYIFTNKIFGRSRDKSSEQSNWVMVPLMCKSLRSTNASEEAKVQKSTLDKVFRVDSFEIQLSKEFNSSWWAAGPDSPFNATSKDHLYISIVANSNESSCSLHVESCQISEQHNSSAGVTLFKHGDSCLRYSAVEEHQTENQKERVYSVKLSSLPWRTAQVFVTCSVLLCAHAPSPYPCTQGCVPGTAPWTAQLALQQVRAGPVHITKEIDLGANYAVITVGLSLAGAVVYIVLILLKRSFVGLYYRGDVRSSRSRRF